MRTFRKLFRMAGAAVALGLLAASAGAAQPEVPKGRLKICKVAGPGVQVGEIFTFNIGSGGGTLQVPAGPAPGGYCKVGPLLPINLLVQVVEAQTSNPTQVINIKVDPPNRLVPGTINLPGRSVIVQIGSGVTEVTFTNKRTGYLEICKERNPPGGTGTYTFYAVAAGSWFGPFTAPVGACTPAIELPAGQVTIYELPGNLLVGCSVLAGPPSYTCFLASGSMTVTVTPGDVSNQTIAVMTNKGGAIPDEPMTDTDNPN